MKEIIHEYGELALAGVIALAVLALVGIVLDGPILSQVVRMCTIAF